LIKKKFGNFVDETTKKHLGYSIDIKTAKNLRANFKYRFRVNLDSMNLLKQNDKQVESFISLVKNHDIECKIDTTGKVQFTSTIIEKGWEEIDPESKLELDIFKSK
jgi:hypothetical protein